MNDLIHLITHLLEAVAWPAAFFATMFMFRTAITKLFNKLTEFEGFGLKFKISREIDNARQELSETEAKDGHAFKLSSPKFGTEEQEMLDLAAVNTRAAVLEAFRRLEVEARRALRRRSIDRDYSARNIYASIREDLRQAEILGPGELKAFDSLRNVRNGIAHSDTQIPMGEATEFVLLALTLKSKLKTVAEGFK